MGIMTKENFAKLLAEIAKRVGEGDSFEGNISYTCLTKGLERHEFDVTAAVRVGNLEGQGGMIIMEASKLNESGVIIGREEVEARQFREMELAFGSGPMSADPKGATDAHLVHGD